MAASFDDEVTLPARVSAAPPKMKLSNSLARAARDEFVYVGRSGEVRSPTRYRVQRFAGLGIAVTAALVGTVLSIAVGLPWLSLLYVSTLGYASNVWRKSEQLKQGAALLAADRIDEAERVLLPLTNTRLAPASIRALAWQNLAGVAVRRGRHAEALASVRRCDAIFRRGFWAPAGPWRWINRFSEVQLLAQLGELEAARRVLAELVRAPSGEYFQILRMNAELMLAFASQDASTLPEDLHAWVHRAIETTTAELALVLLAWAHAQRGDDDMASHLLDEARDRIEPELFARIYPNVARWLQQQRAQPQQRRDAQG